LRTQREDILLVVSVCLVMLQLVACRHRYAGPLFERVSSAVSGISFSNNLTYSDTLSILDFEYMFNGSGVAIIDVNNDGLQDIIFGGNMVSSRLYLNKGNLRFDDITKRAGVETNGWVNGIAVVDINEDGYQDIYICKAGNRNTPPDQMKNLFFINNGNSTFTEKAASMGLDDNGYDIQAAFLDYDKDGDLDMYLLRNAFVSYNRNTARKKIMDGSAPSNDKLFRNDGNMHFTDVSKDAGILVEGFGLGVTICDLNNDNWPDVYVSNDFLTNDLVWINNCNGTFSNKASEYLRHQTYNGMGNDIADYNNDGLEDIVVVDMLPPDNRRWKLTMRGNTYEEFQNALSYSYEPQYVRNTLQLNNGDGTFSEIGQLAGVHATEWSWTPFLADFNNDAYKDLFVSNGYRQDITNLDFIRYGKNALFVGTREANRKERLKELKNYPGIRVHNYLFENNRDLTFKDVSEEWGMDDEMYSNAVAYADLDNDGDLDLVINNLDEQAALFENRCTNPKGSSRWLRIGLKGAKENGAGIGARISVWQKNQMQVGYLSPYRGYLSSVEPFVHFGLAGKVIDSIQVLWPNGSIQRVTNVQANQLVWFDIKNAVRADSAVTIKEDVWFSDITGKTRIALRHREDEFVDFKTQPLLPRILSHEGPPLAAGDVNGDGLTDVFVGAASGGSPSVFIQQADATFRIKTLPLMNDADNLGTLLFDADMDGDQDLYIAAGGSNVIKSNPGIYKHHLFLNDGKGNYTAEILLPNVITSASSVAAADYDRDGDLDLFVAGRLTPGKYPTAPRSYLLRNDLVNSKSVFTDVTNSTGDDLSSLGMITSVLWTDFDNDGWTDLLIAGEFMPIRFFKNHSGSFKEITNNTGLQHTSGWWNSISSGDFDRDGDMDYVLGNLGLNSPYKASEDEPICVYASDYDKDGRLDPVICHFIDGVEYVVAARDDMNKQMTSMRGRFRTYESYASVPFKQTFRDDEIKSAFILKTEKFESSYLENLGGGKFKIHDLPLRAQTAPLYATLTGDFNGDGNLDILGVGNSFSTEVQSGRYDAQSSMMLEGDGKGKFKYFANALGSKGDNKSLIQIHGIDGRRLFIVGANSDSVKVFTGNMKQKWVHLDPLDTYAIVNTADGRSYREEFYFGNTYLSQSERTFAADNKTTSIQIFTSTGSKRAINF
jgi:enediyne biosynthesis protein E4